tara:strand:- start:204 stop:431 length:228 start_codon:yes stop_codon:yes gene_type:complete
MQYLKLYNNNIYMGKKHKKKVYNTPKKIKHVHKNESLNILKSIYNPKCEKCNNNMASHYDRFTCTNCGISFCKNL